MPQVQVGAELIQEVPPPGDGEGSDDEPLEALAVDDFGDDEWFDEDEDDEEEDDDEDSDNFYTAPRFGLRIGASSGNKAVPARLASDDVGGLDDLADLVDAVADDAIVESEPEPVAAPDSTPAMASRGAQPYVEVAELEVKEVHRETSFASEGRPLDSEVMVGDDAPFAITIERETMPRSPPPSRGNDQALPYLALVTSTAGMLAGAALTAIGLVALGSILAAVGDDTVAADPLPPEPEVPAVVEPEASPQEDATTAGTDAATGDTGAEEEEPELDPGDAEPTPQPRRRRRKPEPEPELAPEPAPVPVPVVKPQPVPEPEPEAEEEDDDKKGLFRRKKKK